jgi:hypothetical protein
MFSRDPTSPAFAKPSDRARFRPKYGIPALFA